MIIPFNIQIMYVAHILGMAWYFPSMFYGVQQIHIDNKWKIKSSVEHSGAFELVHSESNLWIWVFISEIFNIFTLT